MTIGIKNPFIQDLNNPSVYVSHNIDAYENTRNVLNMMKLSSVKEKKVLIKPNVGRLADPYSGINTNPMVVAAAIDVFTELGAFVAIGESPITGVDTMEAFQASEIAAIAMERGVILIDMDVRAPQEVEIPTGKAIRKIKVCADVFDYDIIVSIPVMKVHMHTGVTLAVKNMKGCLWRRSKIDLHMLPQIKGQSNKSLDVAIADMSSVLRPHISIVDGSIGMEGLGPSAGSTKQLDVVVAGFEPFAVDAVSCKLMGIDPNEIPHLRIAADRGYGKIDFNSIQVTPGDWQDYAKVFEKSPDNLSIEFPNVTIHDKNSCSACQSTLLLFLKRYGDRIFEYFKETPINIAIGKGHDILPENTLCIGNCTFKHKGIGIYVPGCPPVGSVIFKEIEKYFAPEDPNKE